MGPESKANYEEPHNENSISYDPQADTMVHDSVFSELAPGIVSSGNLAHKWDVPGDHSNGEEPASGLKGD